MRGPEEWPSRRSNPEDRIRLTGPAATTFPFPVFTSSILQIVLPTCQRMDALIAFFNHLRRASLFLAAHSDNGKRGAIRSSYQWVTSPDNFS